MLNEPTNCFESCFYGVLKLDKKDQVRWKRGQCNLFKIVWLADCFEYFLATLSGYLILKGQDHTTQKIVTNHCAIRY